MVVQGLGAQVAPEELEDLVVAEVVVLGWAAAHMAQEAPEAQVSLFFVGTIN